MVLTPAFDLSTPIGNTAAYLVQSLNVDRSPPVQGTGPLWLQSTDKLTWRRRDYPGAGSFAIDCALHPLGWTTAWQALPYDASAAWGGEFWVYSSGAIQGRATQDGGTPGIQWFVGPDGWMVYDEQPLFGAWKSKVIKLNDAPSPSTPYSGGSSYMRWRREVLSLYFSVFGAAQQIVLPCIISEHFNTADGMIADASVVEQLVFALGWGQVWWSAYGPVPSGGAPDLSARIPQAPWPSPPEQPSWVRLDGRLYTNVMPVAAGEANTIQWPPPGFKPL